MPTLPEVLTDVAGELYGLDPARFVPARDARAAALRADGQDEAADRVKRLRKPSAAAWVVNLLARAEADQVEQVVELGAAFRAAQEDLDGPRLRELTRQRRQLVTAVAARARELAVDAGATVSGAVLTQVEATLTAAMIDADAGRAVRSGLLVGPLQATGIGRADVASAVAVADALGIAPVDDEHPRHLHAVPDLPGSARRARGRSARSGTDDGGRAEAARQEAREAARQSLADAEDDVAAAQDAGGAAAAEVGRIEAVAARTDAERDAARRRLAELDDEAAAVEAELRGAVVARQRAERTLADATRRRDEAAARLAEVVEDPAR